LTAHQRFLRTSAAPVAAALIALGAFDAHALSMGKVRVQSALGQSLVAEIDLADLSEDDAKSLKSSLASPSAFAGLGLDYNPALNGTQIALQRRPNGNRYLKLSNNRPLNDPFVDIVVELSWASGRIVRTYTILLDPPKVQESASTPSLPAPVAETPVVTTAPASTPTAAPAAQAAPLAYAPTPQAAPAPAVAATPAAPKAAATAAPAVNPPTTSDADRKRIRVRSGDTAGKIARSLAPEGVTVEQMLVAMLSSNPSAFTDGNVNRLRADAVLVTPDAALAKKTPQSQARQIIDSQNQDFQALRRGLASQAPAAPAPTKQSEAAGPVTKPTAPSVPKAAPSDTLKLSKDSVQDKADKASMEQIAQQRAKTEASERARELAKNIEELNQLAKVAAKPEPAVAPAAPVASAAPAADMAVPASPASAPAPAKSAGPAVTSGLPTVPAAPASGGLLDTALQNPTISGLVLALLGLLAGFGWYRRRQGQQSALAGSAGAGQWNSTASTSFEGGGGGRVDTTDIGTAALSSTFYPDSQLEVAQELDPVAEAEVYLAYGKDVPAEEILKEGLQQDPTRVAIHLKLLGIFAKRGDAKSFDAMAREVSALVQASGPDWAQVQEMGRSLDPSNPLYGAPGAPEADVGAPEGTDYQQSMFSLDAESLQALSPASSAKVVVAEKAPAVSAEPSFDLSSIALEPAPSAQAAAAGAAPSTDRLDATLALAEQFLEIGEKEGARALLEEVISGGSDALRQRATSLLAKAG
jgi:pilus assembly protein FimV